MVRKVPAPKAEKKESTSASRALPFAERLSKPDASAHLPSFGPFSFSVTMDASLAKGKVSALGFETNGPLAFQRLLSESCALFLGKDEDAIEFFTFDAFFAQVSPAPEARDYALYAWTALQDVCARLPFGDPMSHALQKLRFLNREFNHGTLMPDLED